MAGESVLWRRLDAPGHDACRLKSSMFNRELEGTAVFRHNGHATQLSYRVLCDADWRTKRGHVRGWIGNDSVKVDIVRLDIGSWAVNGAIAAGLDHCDDLDLGFTPATNLISLRRLSLAVGDAADLTAAWFDVETASLQVLPQRYERRGDTTYYYEAPSFGYTGVLEADEVGFVRAYPGLWDAER